MRERFISIVGIADCRKCNRENDLRTVEARGRGTSKAYIAKYLLE